MGIGKWVKANKVMSVVLLIAIILIIYFIVAGTKQAPVSEEVETPTAVEGPTKEVVEELPVEEVAEAETPAEEVEEESETLTE